MAPTRICSVEGCGNPHEGRGLCRLHYKRLKRTGSLHLSPDRSPRGEAMAWLNAHVSHEGEECLIWPFRRFHGGYPCVWHNGRETVASRLMCSLAHGEPSDPTLEAAHLCGKGTSGCINPKHLQWKTKAENAEDRVLHGTDYRGSNSPHSVLKDYQVREIRALEGKLIWADIAAKFGVSKSTVFAILKRRSWKWLD